MPESLPRLDGRTVIITGASAGVGAAAAGKFAELGATVAVVGRSAEKTRKVAEAVGGQAFLADFGRLEDVRRLAAELLERYPAIDVLANNAGGAIRRRSTTPDGHELTFQTNYLAPFLLTHLLAPALTKARVISTASAAHTSARIDLDDLDSARGRYSSTKTYGRSKLGNILFSQELARRAAGTGLTASAFHPGLVASEFFRDGKSAFGVFGKLFVNSALGRVFAVTPEQGADPLLHLATTPDADSVNGAYLHLMRPFTPRGPQPRDQEFQRELFDRSLKLLGLAPVW